MPRTKWNTRRMNNKKLHVMFSAGQYRSTEKVIFAGLFKINIYPF